MAHAIFLDYPNWNVAKQDDWVSLFQELDNEIPCTVREAHVLFIRTTQLWKGGPASDRCHLSFGEIQHSYTKHHNS